MARGTRARARSLRTFDRGLGIPIGLSSQGLVGGGDGLDPDAGSESGSFGGGGPPSAADIARVRRQQLSDGKVPQVAGPPGIEKSNFGMLTGSAVGSGVGWKFIGPFPGPVLLVPYLTLPKDALIAHPYEQPPIADQNAFVRSRGNGLLYLPAGGINWAVKYQSAAGDTIRFLIIDARNPNVLAWYMAGINGASKRTLPVSVTLGAASVQIAAENALRTAWMISCVTAVQTCAITWGAAATYAAGPPIVTNGFLLTAPMGPVFFSDETNVREAIFGIRTAAVDCDVVFAEWTD